ncbi:hypothetical protein M2360_003933 [Rhizobium sp. SG_E_25_P2]|nr:hypothetical protein [Rhizobium sp. SG_E_25_P2]
MGFARARIKIPSPTPPHKGEGLERSAVLPPSGIPTRDNASVSLRAGAGVSPSPLWGGVGEGFLNHVTASEGAQS